MVTSRIVCSACNRTFSLPKQPIRLLPFCLLTVFHYVVLSNRVSL